VSLLNHCGVRVGRPALIAVDVGTFLTRGEHYALCVVRWCVGGGVIPACAIVM
jgi:hypothetical protein